MSSSVWEAKSQWWFSYFSRECSRWSEDDLERQDDEEGEEGDDADGDGKCGPGAGAEVAILIGRKKTL